MAGLREQPPDDFAHRVRLREERRLDPNRQQRRLFFGLGMVGVVGWSVAIPLVGATLLGVWLDAHFPSRYSWSLMLLGAGLGLGCLNAWHWLQRERREIIGTEEGKRK
jgi:ATP synthase protein I